MNRNKGSGLSLVELTVAMGLLAVVFTAAFPFLDQVMARFQMSRDHYVAASLCQARIERARGVPFSDLRLLTESQSVVDDFGNLSGPEGRFRRTTTVTTNSPVAGMTMMSLRTDICICTRWGWRKYMHPIKQGNLTCRFTDEHEEMAFLFTEYNK
jgi:type II secretory pathway pseudopilin PulG